MRSHQHTVRPVLETRRLIALAGACCLLIVALPAHGEISQSVSVSAESGSVRANGSGSTSVGESSVSVELRQNGEVIESFNERGTGSIEYARTSTSGSVTSAVSATTQAGSASVSAPQSEQTTHTATDQELLAIIARLETLISLYAKLLSS